MTPPSPTVQQSAERPSAARVWIGRLDPGPALLAVSIVLPAVLFGLAAWQGHRKALDEAEQRVERTVRILHEHAVKVFETQELVIDRVNGRLRFLDWNNEADRADLYALMKRLQDDLDHVATITVADADGHLRASGRAYPVDPRVTFTDRDWFQALQAAPHKPAYVSRSYLGRQSGQSVFNVAGRIEGRTPGAFEGAIVISVDRSYFETFYASVEPTFAHAILLVREDGEILAREPATAVPRFGSDTTPTRRGSDGVFRTRSGVDGVERLFSYRKVGLYPVYIGFGLDIDAALAPWRRDLRAYGLVAALAAATLLAVSTLANRRAARERLATARWQEAAERVLAEAAARERAEAQSRQSQKMEAVGRLTGGVAHDFNNLLTVIVGSLDLLRRRLTGADERHARLITNALEGANRAATLTARLLAFSRQQPLTPEALDVNRLVSGMSDLLQRTLGETYIIETALAEGLWLTLADPNQLESALLNLAVNARDAMPEGGKLTIETANAHLDEAYAAANAEVIAGEYVMIAACDTGSGIAPDVLARVFEPFFTTKEVGKGTGLGLSQVYGYAKQSGGHVAIHSEPGRGTTVKIYLPRLRRADGVKEIDRGEAETPVAAGAGETILVVEDDAAVRDLSVGVLRDAGYRVLDAQDGAGGLTLLRAHPEIALLFTDVVLTGPTNGRQLADAARTHRPDLPVLFTTGYTRNAILDHGRLDESVNLLGKPFTPDALRNKIGALLARSSSPAGSGPRL